MTDNNGKSLVAKLAEACDKVSGVEKKGRNEFQRYNYLKAADVAKAIRHELFSRGIVVVIDEKEFSPHRKIETNGGHFIEEFLLKCEVTFTDGVEKLATTAFATAMDSGDKAIYKAKTAVLKYSLRNIGLIPDELDDPEYDESIDEQTQCERTAALPPSPRETKASRAEYQVRAWASACQQYGKTPEQASEYLETNWKVKTVADLSRKDFDQAVKWAVAKEDQSETLENIARRAEARQKKQPSRPNGEEPRTA
jgi:hypothetical protein